MGQVGDGTVVAPFANAAMRLLREDWKGKYGSKMLSEELYPILQTGIPQPDQNFQNFITINAGVNDTFAKLVDKFGNLIYTIDAPNGLQKIESPGYPPPKLKPRIVWGPKTIASGSSIGPSELDAVAVDPETGVEIPGVYVYTPPDGTTFTSPPATATLYVDFTPTDGVKYRRAKGSTVLTVTGGGALTPIVIWPDPADMTIGTALSGTQLNATAIDPITSDPVPGIFTYTPPSGTVLGVGDAQPLHVDFVPTDTVTYTNASGDQTVNVKTLTYLATFFATKSTPGTTLNKVIGVTAGDFVLIFAGTSGGGTSGVTFALSDSQANAYTQIGSTLQEDTGGGSPAFIVLEAYWAIAASTGTLTITVTASSSITFGLTGHQFSRSHPTSPINVFSSSSAHLPSTPATISTGTVGAAAGNTIVAAFSGNPQTFTPLSPYTDLGNEGNSGNSQMHVAVSGAEAATATNNSGSYVAIGVAIKPPV